MKVNLVVYFDEAYAPFAAVTIASILDNRGQSVVVDLSILDCGVDRTTKKVMSRWLRGFSNFSFRWIDCNLAFAQELDLMAHFSAAVYARLAIGHLLPPEIKRVITLDSDIVVLSDIAELWACEIEGHIAGAAVNIYNPTLGSVKRGLFDAEAFDDAADYYNSGVMIVDVDGWRRANILEKCVDIGKAHKGSYANVDQCLINAALYKRIKRIPIKWNCTDGLAYYPNWKVSPFSKTEFNEALESPKIVHFTTDKKPWNRILPGKADNKFFEYASSVPFEVRRRTRKVTIDEVIWEISRCHIGGYQALSLRKRFDRLQVDFDTSLEGYFLGFLRKLMADPIFAGYLALYFSLRALRKASGVVQSRQD